LVDDPDRIAFGRPGDGFHDMHARILSAATTGQQEGYPEAASRLDARNAT
jgi:hypothetical protein